MDDEKYAERKSRIFHQQVGKAPVWRSVGSITIVSPDHDEPVFLKGMAYTVFLHEAKDQTQRESVIVLKRWSLPPDIWKVRFFLLFGGAVAIAIARGLYLLMAN